MPVFNMHLEAFEPDNRMQQARFVASVLALGGILSFAVHATVAGLDISTVGVILMGAGALSLVLTMVVFAPRRRTSVTSTQVAPAATVSAPSVVSQQTRTDEA